MLEIIYGFMGNMFKLFIIATFLPFIVRIIMQLTLNWIKNLIKIDLVPMLDVIAIPGAFLKNLPINIFLKSKGWDTRSNYRTRIGASITNLSRGRDDGFSLYQTPADKTSEELDNTSTVIIMALSYFGVLFFFLWLKYLKPIGGYLTYLFGPVTSQIIVWVFTLSLIIGGLPTPNETMLPITFYFKKNPHMIIAMICNFIAAVIASDLWGSSIATTIFILFSALNYILLKYFEWRIDNRYGSVVPNIDEFAGLRVN